MRILAAALALGFALACGGDPDPPPPVEHAPAPTQPEPVPEPEAQFTGADCGANGDAANGAAMYGQYCAVCHGVGGKGDGPTAQALDPKPADHTDKSVMGALSDERLFLVIKKGGAAVGKSLLMAQWGGVVNDDQICDLVAHLRRLSGS
jgi:mono/diheme cytochrome c family protein